MARPRNLYHASAAARMSSCARTTEHVPAQFSEERWAFLSRTTSQTRAHSPTLTGGWPTSRSMRTPKSTLGLLATNAIWKRSAESQKSKGNIKQKRHVFTVFNILPVPTKGSNYWTFMLSHVAATLFQHPQLCLPCFCTYSSALKCLWSAVLRLVRTLTLHISSLHAWWRHAW